MARDVPQAPGGSLDRHPDFPEFFRLARESVANELAPRYERAVTAGNAGAAERVQTRIDELARQQAIVALRSMTEFERQHGPIGRQPPETAAAPPTLDIRPDQITDRMPLSLTGQEQERPNLAGTIMEGSPVDFGERMLTPGGRPPPPTVRRGPGVSGLDIALGPMPSESTVFRRDELTPESLAGLGRERDERISELSRAGAQAVLPPAGQIPAAITRAVAATGRTLATHPAATGATIAGLTTLGSTAETQQPDPLEERLRRGVADDERRIATMSTELAAHQASLKALQEQRAAALVEMRAQREGGVGRQAGIGPRYRAQEEAVARLDAQITTLNDNTITPLTRQISSARERLTPEHRARQRQIAGAEAERDRILADSPKPFREEYPGLTRLYFLAPFIGGAAVASWMRLRPAFAERAQVQRWWQSVEEAQSATDPARRAAALSRAEAFERAIPRATWREIAGYYGGPMAGGASIGAALSNIPEIRDIFTLPYENPRRRALEEYIKLLPEDHPEMQRLVQRLTDPSMDRSNPDRQAAIEHFTRISPAFVRALEGALSGMAGAETVTGVSHALSRRYEASMPRPETEALLNPARRPPPPSPPPAPTGAFESGVTRFRNPTTGEVRRLESGGWRGRGPSGRDVWRTAPPATWERISMQDRIDYFGGYPVG